MRKIVINALFMLLISCITLSTAMAQPTASTQHKKLPTLFVISAESASVNQHNNIYTLELTSPDVTYFTDRPYRKAGQLSASQFKNLWLADKNSFRGNHPNAFVAGLNTRVTKKDSQVVVLSEPKINNHAMSFTIKQLNDHHTLEVGHLGRATIFVDMFNLGEY